AQHPPHKSPVPQMQKQLRWQELVFSLDFLYLDIKVNKNLRHGDRVCLKSPSRTCANKDAGKCLPNRLIPLAFAPGFLACPLQIAPQQGRRLKMVRTS
ncbi:MAG: hypothetical protein ACKO5Z_01740, partial [Burkholderiaceae bacterium]